MQVSGQPEDALTAEVVDALAASPVEAPPGRLRSRVLGAALEQRRAGRPPGFVAISPVEGYRRTVAELDRLLERLAGEEWRATVEPYGWSVQGLVGHLLAVERALGALLGIDGTGDRPDPADPADRFDQADPTHDHIGMTLRTVAAQDDRAPFHTLADWRVAARRVLGALSAGVGGDQGGDQGDDERVELYGLTWRWDTLLVVRTLEMWTHTDDVRRAIGRPLVAPDAERLGLMTDLAVRTIPQLVATEPAPGSTAAPAHWVRFVLTGPGGGAWTRPVGTAGAARPTAERTAAPAARIVADAVGFCRLTAGRLTVAELRPRVDGDRELAARLLDHATAFAA
jgi:uncharacterized protein (TIGR03083 family)